VAVPQAAPTYVLLLDTAGGHLYVAGGGRPGAVAEVSLADFAIEHVAYLSNSQDGTVWSGVIDPAARQAYFASDHYAGGGPVFGVVARFRLAETTPTPSPTPPASPSATATLEATAPATATATATPPLATATATPWPPWRVYIPVVRFDQIVGGIP
jgi:hypothetical protein